MAARDRFGSLGAPAQSTLQRFIQSACDPANYEPNLALDLEIADLINNKKGNAPREAAVAIVNYINHRNPNVSLLALTLLDICVKNCGYPFHLQISTKEFLNELVRRFPERPPMRPSRVQLRILEAIEEWRQTICKTSRYKDDLGFIRDMHRLLSYKGYMFPEIKREDAAVLNPSDNLKSAEEMEEEERAAQSAKLQELIRRGRPEDLQEANKLMKVMAGYDTRHRTDYRAKAAEEVSKVQQKAKILEEMLQGLTREDKIAEGDVFEELANALQSAQPKIQKMCEEESEDHEAVAKLFEINDSIHRTLERYKLMKKGDFDAASKIPKGTLGTSGAAVSTKSNDNNELSLIDLDLNPPSEPAESRVNVNGDGGGGKREDSSNNKKMESSEDDLMGLSFQSTTYGQGGGIALGLGSNPNLSAQPSPSPSPLMFQSGQGQGPSTPPIPAFGGVGSSTSTPTFNMSSTISPLQMQQMQAQQQRQSQLHLSQQTQQEQQQQQQKQPDQQPPQKNNTNNNKFGAVGDLIDL
ncbi:MAG: Nucleolar protein 9 [Watsoniomyces obsoletus]|nr:MAG: Nucleolar protein 9 [Watsoniomyces obsoletus]